MEEEESQPIFSFSNKYNPLDEDGERERIDNFLENTISNESDFRPDFRESRAVPLTVNTNQVLSWNEIAEKNQKDEPIYKCHKFKNKKKKIIPFQEMIDPFSNLPEDCEAEPEPSPKSVVNIYQQSDFGENSAEQDIGDDEFEICPKKELTMQIFLKKPKSQEEEEEQEEDDYAQSRYPEEELLDEDGIPIRWGRPKPIDIDVTADLEEEDIPDELQDYGEIEIDYPENEDGMDLDAFNGQY